jgi:uncharacterized protein YgiM (DUF1202 family)
MSGKIFINYRRDDASHLAGRLYDRLAAHFPKNQIFIDVDNLDPGVDFVEAIEQSVGSCDVLIAVIGRHWLISTDEKRRRRLDDPDDFVRLEIATALKRNIRVIPVLVDGATMPRPSDLPGDLKSLVRRNAVEVSHTRFSADSERLIAALERVFEKTAAEQREREEKERLEVQRRRETELKERLEAERQQKEERDRLETEQKEREKDRLEPVPQSQLPSPVALSTPPAQPEPDKPSLETPKVVYPLPPKPSESERVKPPPPSSGGIRGKSPSKQVIAFLAIAAVLVVAGLIYFATRASQPSPSQASPVAVVPPGPPAIATPSSKQASDPRLPWPDERRLKFGSNTANYRSIKDSLALRASPTNNSEILKQIPAGAENILGYPFDLVSTGQDTWIPVEYEDVKGYVNKSSLDLISVSTQIPLSSSKEASDPALWPDGRRLKFTSNTANYRVASREDFLALRASPTNSSEILKQIPAGAENVLGYPFDLVSTGQDTWIPVEYENVKGYVNKSFLHLR